MGPKVETNSNNNLKYDNLIKGNENNKPEERIEESIQQQGQKKIELFTE